MEPKFPTTMWRIIQIVIATLVVWLILLAVFAKDRICDPIMSARCRTHFFDYLGDAVWLVNLKEWQTLFAGLMAIGAASIGAYFINRQIQQTERHEQERRQRLLAAERAMMPMALSALMDFMVQSNRCLVELSNEIVEGILPKEATLPSMPPPPMEGASSLQRMVTASSALEGDPYAKLLSRLQVFNDKLRWLEAYPRHFHLKRLDALTLDDFQDEAATLLLDMSNELLKIREKIFDGSLPTDVSA